MAAAFLVAQTVQPPDDAVQKVRRCSVSLSGPSRLSAWAWEVREARGAFALSNKAFVEQVPKSSLPFAAFHDILSLEVSGSVKRSRCIPFR